MALVKFDSGPRSGEVVSLDKPKITFGRQPSCDCVLKHPTVSREHFYIERNAGKYFAIDQESGNGTFANGTKISWLELKDGDRIQAGPFTLVVELPEKRDVRFKNEAEASDRTSPLDEADNQPSNERSYERIYPREYLQGIKLFNTKQYFDAHEIWEEIWLRSSGETKLFYQMLIQAAVGLHHYERGNSRGARGMYKNVCEKLTRLPSFFMSVDLNEFEREFKKFFADLIESETETTLPPDLPRPLICLSATNQDD
jgi:pSer/pThr/pTyr-binding forkhead associated (FHA) protein